MSEANVKLAQQAYGYFGTGNIPAVIEMLTPDIVFGIVGRKEDAPFLGMNHGHAGAAEFFKQLDAAHEIHTFEPLRFLGAEDKVFVWGRYRWTMRKSGISKETTWLHEFTCRDGKISAWLGHNDTAMLAEAYYGVPMKRAANG